jgi:hypothetical protein
MANPGGRVVLAMCEVGEVGQAVVSFPPFEVVGLRPGGGAIAAGGDAASVADGQGDPLVAAGQTGVPLAIRSAADGGWTGRRSMTASGGRMAPLHTCGLGPLGAVTSRRPVASACSWAPIGWATAGPGNSPDLGDGWAQTTKVELRRANARQGRQG